MRAFVLDGVASDKHYTFGVQAYRNVDQDIESSGILKSSLIVPVDCPYRPTEEVAFAGDIIGTINHIPVANIETVSGSQTKVDLAISGFINGVYTDDINSLQSQIDGQITTWFYEYEPTLLNIPASEWTTNELKNNHLGDLFYNTDTGYAYRFAYINSVYQWKRITDTDVVKALADAKNAQDTADRKKNCVFNYS